MNDVMSEKDYKMHELIFFAVFGSLSVAGIAHHMYFWHLVNSVRLSMAYSLTYLAVNHHVCCYTNCRYTY